jgi:hypothetical protein
MATSAELPVAASANSWRVPSGAVGVAAGSGITISSGVGKENAAATGFWSLLDDCLSDDAALHPSEQPQPHPEPNGKRQRNDPTAPTTVSVPATPPVEEPNPESVAITGAAPERTGAKPPSATPDEAGQESSAIPELAFAARLVPAAPAVPAAPLLAAASVPKPPNRPDAAGIEATESSGKIAGNSPGVGSALSGGKAGNGGFQAMVLAKHRIAEDEAESNEPAQAENTGSGDNPRGPAPVPGAMVSGKPNPVPACAAVPQGSPQSSPSSNGPAAAGVGNGPGSGMPPAALISTPRPANQEAQPANPAPAPETPLHVSAVETPEPPAQPVSHDVSLHLADGQNSVDIRMAERAGEIRVTVHTPDRDLADSLRADLPDLVGRLRQSGFQAEAWRPPAAAQPDGDRRGGPDARSSQHQSPGARKDGRQTPSGQQQQQKNQTRWAGEWNSTLDPVQESSI